MSLGFPFLIGFERPCRFLDGFRLVFRGIELCSINVGFNHIVCAGASIGSGIAYFSVILTCSPLLPRPVDQTAALLPAPEHRGHARYALAINLIAALRT